MSTRAHIRVVDRNHEIALYRHCDGYPEGTGPDLEKVAKECNWSDEEEIAAQLVRIDPTDRCPTFTPASCVHGDEEYFWVVDLKKKEIRFGDSKGQENEIYKGSAV